MIERCFFCGADELISHFTLIAIEQLASQLWPSFEVRTKEDVSYFFVKSNIWLLHLDVKCFNFPP